MPVGRPRIIESPEILEERLDEYLEQCEEQDKPVTLTRMVTALGFNCKQSFYEYGARPEYTDSIKRARHMVEMAYEDGLHGTTPTGSIFALKNMEWSDKMELSSDPDRPLIPVLNVFNSDK